MNITFNNIVDAAYKLPINSRLELKNLLENNIVETRRSEIAQEFKQSKEDLKNNKLKFSSNINQFKKML